MKKILLSLLTVGVVGGLAFGASQAFFTDVETSSGNTFAAGDLDLRISSNATYNSSPVPGSTWDPANLTSEKFFNFTDLKPGDWGENTITFTVSNDAWMCANLTITQNVNLGNYLEVFWWVDDNNDNIYQVTEKKLYDGPNTINQWLTLGGGTGSLPLTFADSYLYWETWPGTTPPNTDHIPADTPKHLGVGWCFGDLSADGTGVRGFSCDGSDPANNNAQNGSVVGTLAFTVEQWRNNPNFKCPEHEGM